MKNEYLKFLVPAMLMMPLLAHADEAVFEIAQSDCNVSVKTESNCNETPSFYEYHNRISVFGPLHQAYERIKTDAFYVGVEAWLLNTVSNRCDLLGEAELRFGYNFFYNGRDHVTPFVGTGVIDDYGLQRVRQEFFHHYKRKPPVVYGVFGILYDHEFNRLFNLGFNVKGLVGGSVKKHHLNWGSPVVGIDVAIPITFRFGYRRHWDCRIEPFYIYLHGSQISQNYFGGRSTIGYRF